MLDFLYTLSADERSRIMAAGYRIPCKTINVAAVTFEEAEALLLPFAQEAFPSANITALDGLLVVL